MISKKLSEKSVLFFEELKTKQYFAEVEWGEFSFFKKKINKQTFSKTGFDLDYESEE